MSQGRAALESKADQIKFVLAQHKVAGHVRGGVVTPKLIQFQVVAAPGVKVSKVASLSEEIALVLGCSDVRIYRQKGIINVEVPRINPASVRLPPLASRLAETPPLKRRREGMI